MNDDTIECSKIILAYEDFKIEDCPKLLIINLVISYDI